MTHAMRCATLLAALLAAPAQAADAGAAPPKAQEDEPLSALPYTPGLDPSAMDRAADPCVDFYAYSCGGWQKKNPIPPDEAGWSVSAKLQKDNLRLLWGLLAECATPSAGRSPQQQKIGDYFAACMDERAIEARGAAPLKPVLDEIAALTSVKELAPLFARLQRAGSPVAPFRFASDQDFADSEQVIASTTAGGLGLPDRDYYVRTDKKSLDLRQKYVWHVRRMLELLGDTRESASASAKAVLAMETALARASLTLVERRNPHNLDHKMTREKLKALSPKLDWDAFFEGVGQPEAKTLNVAEPQFLRRLDALLAGRTLADWKAYLRWRAVLGAAEYLSEPFVAAHFDFFDKTLRGKERLPPRWKRCVEWVDRDLGEALGEVFVLRTFAPDTKERALRMTAQVKRAMESELGRIDWVGPATKERALEKLHAMVDKIGYPDKWRDYTALSIARDDFFGNVRRGEAFEDKRQLDKIGKPLDRGEWDMTPPTVNAYFNPQVNDLNFPAGVLQPPLFDPRLDDAPNYGNTGATIGHELTHGFDDEGRLYDAKGNLKDWWTKKDAAQFQQRIQCVIDQYAQYVVVDEIKINSKLSAGEDVADLGGTWLAWLAWKNATREQDLKPADGLSPEQRFFVGMAQWACSNERPEDLRMRAATDPHSPTRYRVNGVVANLPEFGAAFQCKKGQPMMREKPCRVW